MVGGQVHFTPTQRLGGKSFVDADGGGGVAKSVFG